METGSYFLRRLLSINRPPERSAKALAPELASISGTGATWALAIIAMPAKSNIIPAIFIDSLLVVVQRPVSSPLPEGRYQVHSKRESRKVQSYGHSRKPKFFSYALDSFHCGYVRCEPVPAISEL